MYWDWRRREEEVMSWLVSLRMWLTRSFNYPHLALLDVFFASYLTGKNKTQLKKKWKKNEREREGERE